MVRSLITRAMLPVLCVPAVALADERAPAPLATDAQIHGAFNNGEDLTAPRNRFDFRQRYERLPDADGGQPSKWVTTLRADLWTGFADGWKVYGRLDQPFIYSEDVTSSFNPNGHSRFGQGDFLTEMVIVPPPPTPRLGYGLGIRVVWPTAGLNEAGDGKYQVGPVAAARYALPEISSDSFFLTEVIYLNSLASRNENAGRPDISLMKIQPKLNVGLPDGWFLATYASEGIQVNYNDSGKAFVPIDLMIGKKLFHNIVMSL